MGSSCHDRRTPLTALRLLVIPIMLFGCASQSPDWSEVAPEGINMSGEWVLNVEESDPLPERLGRIGGATDEGRPTGDMPQGGSPGAGGRRPAGVGMRGGGGRPGGAMADPERVRQLASMVRDRLERFTISQTDSSFSVAGSFGEIYDLPTDGSRVTQEWEGYWTVEMMAGWVERELVVIRQVDDAGKLTESYSPSYTGDRLLVTALLDIEGRGEPMELRFVYDRAS